MQSSIYNMDSSYAVKVFAVKMLLMNDYEKAAKFMFEGAQGKFDDYSSSSEDAAKFWECVVTELTSLDEEYSSKTAAAYLILVMELLAESKSKP